MLFPLYLGCPYNIQADRGTENSVIGALQSVLRQEEPGFGRENGFQHIASKLNQRIESWWSFLRKRFAQWWINFFMDLVNSGTYVSHDDNSMKCLRYVFMPLIQQYLDEIAEQWNNHQISLSRNAHCPNGRPSVLYAMPEISGARDCIHPVNEELITMGFTKTLPSTLSGLKEFDDIAAEMTVRLGLMKPDTWQEALKNYYMLYDAL
ncbi:uncharacterized protein LOC117315168 [Pecten maximus]|uniref:uncharacterized protein LOC117315168 n=1 Tax=Pecten maximus TaxID=6579 RepID=UPI00145824DB|nr:uncharacterized protein LOC117315168 [Pecten maximus]